MFSGRLGVVLVAAIFGVVWSVLWSGANYFSGLQADRYPLYLSFERGIPFVPWMMIIYFSMDIAVVVFLFIFRNWREAVPPVGMLLIQLVIAVPFFIFLPMEVGFVGPHPQGVWGDIFAPYGYPDYSRWNHVPSLHVTYSFTMALVLGQRWGCFWMIGSTIWAALVSVSTMLVHEHHLIDVVSGLVLFLITAATVLPWLKSRMGLDSSGRSSMSRVSVQ
jgi:membrane-associated phospholipid phosphatase